MFNALACQLKPAMRRWSAASSPGKYVSRLAVDLFESGHVVADFHQYGENTSIGASTISLVLAHDVLQNEEVRLRKDLVLVTRERRKMIMTKSIAPCEHLRPGSVEASSFEAQQVAHLSNIDVTLLPFRGPGDRTMHSLSLKHDQTHKFNA